MAKEPKPPSPKIDPREYIDFLLTKLKIERYFYVVATGASVALLFYCVVILLEAKDYKSALILFAPCGAVTLCCGRILKIWNDCMKIIIDYLR